jgi:hypothetical protein
MRFSELLPWSKYLAREFSSSPILHRVPLWYMNLIPARERWELLALRWSAEPGPH